MRNNIFLIIQRCEVIILLLSLVTLCACGNGGSSTIGFPYNSNSTPADDDSITVWLTESLELCNISDDSSELYMTTTYAYDANGNIIKETTTSSSEAGEMITTYVYDSYNNQTIRKIQTPTDLVTYYFNYTYDHAGNILTIVTSVEPEIDESVRNEMTYDSNGNLLTESSYSTTDGLQYTKIYQYDSENNLIREEFDSYYGNYVYEMTYDSKGWLLTMSRGADFIEMTYDIDGNVLSIMNNGVIRVENTYFNGNCVIRKDYSSEGILESRFVGTYDSNGNLIQVEIYDSSDTLLGVAKWTYIPISVDPVLAEEIIERSINFMEGYSS